MVPFACRLLVFAAAWIVPKPKRPEWKREWHSELWHRAQSGARPGDLLRCAAGVFRDAAWFRETERKAHGVDYFRQPLRTEALFLAAAFLIALLSGTFRAPQLPYADAGRLVTFERNVAFMGAFDTIMSPKLPGLLKTSQAFDSVALYRVNRNPVLGMRVSRNFFDVLGVKPLLGRTFRSTDESDVVILPYDVWRGRLRSDPAIIGKSATIDARSYTIVGVMPSEFWFRSPRVQFFAPFSFRTTAAGAVGRLKPGMTLTATQIEARKLAFQVEPRWFAGALQLSPLLRDYRLADLALGLEIALLGAVLGVGFLIIKGLGKPPLRYWSLLGARIGLVVLGLAVLRMSVSRPRSAVPFSWDLFAFWIFLLMCSAAVCLLVTDHRGRCLVCLGKLRKPVAIGSWSSQILDQPATEYVCTEGHGTLYIAETGNAPDYWTTLDESWQDLFADSKR